MASVTERRSCLAATSFLFLFTALYLSPAPVRAQESSDDMGFRMSRAEIAVTVRDSSGEPIKSAGSVRLLRNGMQAEQSALTHGRAFFVVGLLGDYSVVVDAAGYKPAQRDISILTAVKYEMEINLQRVPAGNEVDNLPGKPVLAPKAKDAFDKALKAMDANK